MLNRFWDLLRAARSAAERARVALVALLRGEEGSPSPAPSPAPKARLTRGARLSRAGLVDRVLVKAGAHLEMMRPYTMFHSGMVAVAGTLVASGGTVAPWRAALAGIVTICGWEAGLYAGDYYDREIDARSKPDRAIPSGRVSPREAFATMVALIGAGYLAALRLGWANLVLAVATTALGIAYSKTFKGQAILGNFDRGVLGVCAVAFGALAGGKVFSLPVAALATLVFFHDSTTNLVGAIRDVEGDRAADCPTVPVVYGLARAVEIASALALGWVLAAAVLFPQVRPGPLALALLGTALALDLGVYLPMFAHRARVSRPEALRAHKVFVAERLLVDGAVIAALVPAPIALSLLGTTLALTLGSQVFLRDRYERQRIRLTTEESSGSESEESALLSSASGGAHH